MQKYLKAAAAAIDHAMIWSETDEPELWMTVCNCLHADTVGDLPTFLPPMRNPLGGLRSPGQLAHAVSQLGLAGLASHPVTGRLRAKFDAYHGRSPRDRRLLLEERGNAGR